MHDDCETEQTYLNPDQRQLIVHQWENVEQLDFIDEKHEEPHDDGCFVGASHKFQGSLQH